MLVQEALDYAEQFWDIAARHQPGEMRFAASPMISRFRIAASW